MMYRNFKRKPVFTSIMVAAMLMLMVFPTAVFAEGEEPGADDEPAAEEAAYETEVLVEGEESNAGESSPVVVEAESGLPEPQVAVVEDTTAVVEELSAAELVVVDEAGEALPMASQEAAQVISAPDPWVVRGGVTHRFMADCTLQPVDANNTCTVTTTPVQDAINFALSGETVHIGAGTFVEDIEVIGKDITLKGEPGAVILSPDVINAEFNVSGTDRKPIVYVSNATVTIDSITVDGAGKGNANYSFIGIAYYNAGGTISNNTVMNIQNTPFSGAQHGVGIYAYNNDGVARELNVIGNVVQNFQKNGMALFGSELTVHVEDNVVFGIGDTSVTAQNGIQVSGVKGGTIKNNKVGDVWYTGPNWGSTAILVYNVQDLMELEGNEVTNSQMGINVTNSTIAASGNLIKGNDWGVIIYGDESNGTLTGNTFEGNYVGVYVTDPSVAALENLFLGNTYAFYGDPGTNQAIYNYWNCDHGPFGGEGCEEAYGANYDPWLIDPDGDWIFEASDGAAKYVDNCPDVYNPDQTDLDMDGIGDVCDACLDVDDDGACDGDDNCPGVNNPEQTDLDMDGIGDVCDACVDIDDDGVCDEADNCFGVYNPGQADSDQDGIGNACDRSPFPPESEPFAPAEASPIASLIPVTGGEMAALSCEFTSALALPDGQQVIFNQIMCGYEASLSQAYMESLPADLPQGSAFVSGLTLNLMKDGALVRWLDTGTLSLSFAAPESAAYAVLFWDAEAGEWMEITPLSIVDGSAIVTVDFTGSFVLVTK